MDGKNRGKFDAIIEKLEAEQIENIALLLFFKHFIGSRPKAWNQQLKN